LTASLPTSFYAEMPSTASKSKPSTNSSTPDDGQPGRKRARTNTLRAGDAASGPVMPAVSIASVDADVELTDADSAQPLLFEARHIVVVGDLTAGNSLVHPEVLGKMGELLNMQISSQLNALDFVVGRYVLASSDDQWELTKVLMKSFEGCNLPQSQPFCHEDGSALGMLWWRTGGSRVGHLAKTKESVYRVWKSRSFIWATPLISVWPPPIVAGPGIIENTVWTLQLKCADTEQSALRAIARQLESRYVGAFFAKVCDGMLQGNPLLTSLVADQGRRGGPWPLVPPLGVEGWLSIRSPCRVD
jgi:hypothetical protein